MRGRNRFSGCAVSAMICSLVTIGFTIASAAVPGLINFQGILRNSSGNPVADGNYSVVFTIYNAPSGGTSVWSETQSVSTQDGLFTVLLGNTPTPIPPSVFEDSSRYLGVQVAGDPEMVPRQKLSSVGFSFVSSQWTSSGSDVYRTGGNVGIGGPPGFDAKLNVYTSLSSALPVMGLSVNASNPSFGPAYGIRASGGASEGTGERTGVSGLAQGYTSSLTSFGLHGTAYGGGSAYPAIGCYGVAYSNSHGIGGDFLADGPGAGRQTGVQGTARGQAFYDSAIGVSGIATGNSTGPTFGGRFTSTSPGGNSYGGHFSSTSSSSFSSYGVYATADDYGVYATSGAYGIYATGDNFGVYAQSAGSGTGVVGLGSTGVYGQSSVSGNAAVLGYNGGNVSTYGVYSFGDARVSRNLTVDGDSYMNGFIFKNGGGFRIDHPEDPANKYLYHSFVESPDMKNMYDGVVTTDAQGHAEIALPQWFGALNRDFRYQLTVIGQFAQAIISAEVVDNHFSIQTDKPNVKVSWQVTGIRKDAAANAHRIPVEETKAGRERGYYVAPAAFGQPEEKGMAWAHGPEMMKEMKEKAAAESERK